MGTEWLQFSASVSPQHQEYLVTIRGWGTRGDQATCWCGSLQSGARIVLSRDPCAQCVALSVCAELFELKNFLDLTSVPVNYLMVQVSYVIEVIYIRMFTTGLVCSLLTVFIANSVRASQQWVVSCHQTKGYQVSLSLSLVWVFAVKFDNLTQLRHSPDIWFLWTKECALL